MLNFSNWPLYIDYDEKTKKHPTLDEFTAKTGIKVNYFEDINAERRRTSGRSREPLSQGHGIDRDIIVITDNARFPALMIDKGWVEELDKDKIPNIANLHGRAEASRRSIRTARSALPWQSGMTGIAWNEKVSGPVTSVTQLLDGPEAEGQGHRS